METNDNPSSETLAGDAQLTASDGGETVANTASLSLEDVNKIFGTTFKDPDAALKAIKETKSFVGKKVETSATAPAQSAAEQSDPELKAQVQSLRNDLFFSSNPQYQEYRLLIEKLGTDPAEVVGSDDFKKVFEKAKVADEVEQKKSVVHSSNRLAQTGTVIDSAIKIANTRASNEDVAAVLAKGITDELSQS